MTQLEEIVYAAAKLLPHTDELIGIHEKDGLKNIVTEYDIEIQTFLESEIKRRYKNCCFISEESIHDNVDPEKLLFVIDPIDGTTNFYNNCKFSCISVAMLKKGKVIEAAIYNPYLNEMFHSEKDKGSTLNDKPLRIKDAPLSKSIVGYTNCPYDKSLFDVSFEFGKRILNSALDFRRMGSSALEICYSAMGRYQIYCELALYPWDYLAASLIVKEAGGIITDLDGKELLFNKRCSVVSGCPTAHKEVLTICKKMKDEGKYKIEFNTSLYND